MNPVKSSITLNSFPSWHRLASNLSVPAQPPAVLDSHSSYYPASVVIFLWSMSCLFSIETIFGNLLVLVAYRLERSIRLQLSSHFIVSLAVSDLIIGMEGFPMLTLYVVKGERWPLGNIMCQIWLCIDYTLCLVSILTVLLITVDRYGSVCFPAKYRQWQTERKVQVMVVLSWLFPSVLFIMMIFGWENFTGETIEQTDKCYAPFLNDPYVNMSMYIVYYWTILIAISVLYRGIHLAARNLEKRNVARHQRTMALMLGQRYMAQVSLGLYFHAETEDDAVESSKQPVTDRNNTGKNGLTEGSVCASPYEAKPSSNKPIPTIRVGDGPMQSEENGNKSSNECDSAADLADGNLESTCSEKLSPLHVPNPVMEQSCLEKKNGRSRRSAASASDASSFKLDSSGGSQGDVTSVSEIRSKHAMENDGINENSRSKASRVEKNIAQNLYTSEEEDEDEEKENKQAKKTSYRLYGAISINPPVSKRSLHGFFFKSRHKLKREPKNSNKGEPSEITGLQQPPAEDPLKPLMEKLQHTTKGSGEGKEQSTVNKHNNWLSTFLLSPTSFLQRRRKITKAERRARRAFRTITVIVGTFALFWSPYYIVATIYGFCPKCVPSPLFLTSYYLCYLNSSFNPFAYAFANRSFRRTFIRILRGDLLCKIACL
ncbi:unnamed protein product [Soboliphyme baturini]|uniref:G_PROTEIN_RECEP_F1_2 domain-containing protein n=1 Tax=Soboliphyme baturini TaxID=241478 RepID=A0A183IFL6_9BILA|nr:unnamed protein product [Soboliphyme baturini]